MNAAIETLRDALDEVAESVDLVPRDSGLGILKMRDYQITAVDSTYESWREHNAVVVVLATGLGKTVVAAEAIMRWPRHGRILVIAHTRELIFQARELIGRHIDEEPSIEMGEYREAEGGHPLLDRAKVVVASIQTLTRRLEKFRPEDFDLIIIDEFHHSVAPSYRRVWNYFLAGNPSIKLLGITATPHRADGISLRGIAQHCAFEMGIREGIDNGWLVPILQKYIVVEGLDFSKCRTDAADLKESDLECAMMGGAESDGMTAAEKLELIAKQEAMLHRIADPAIKEAQGRSGIVFCVTVSHANRMAEVLRRYPGVAAEVVTGDTLTEQRAEIVKRFKAGQIQFLCGVGCFTEGFDCPNAQVIVMARPTQSQSLYIQMLGRGTRPLPGLVDQYVTAEERQQAIANSPKPSMVVLDFVGNSGKHKLVSSADVLAGDMPEELIEAAKEQITASGEAQDIRAAAWKQKQLRDEEEDRQRKEQEERQRQVQLLEEARRNRIRAEAQYRSRDIDPFDQHDIDVQRPGSVYRGGSTDPQINALVAYGIARETAMSWTKEQASAVISQYKQKCGGQFIVTFGKHAGKTLRQILDADLGWLQFMVKNSKNVEVLRNIDQFREEYRAELKSRKDAK
jgi:superfamily II DNA or RNA helicase